MQPVVRTAWADASQKVRGAKACEAHLDGQTAPSTANLQHAVPLGQPSPGDDGPKFPHLRRLELVDAADGRDLARYEAEVAFDASFLLPPNGTRVRHVGAEEALEHAVRDVVVSRDVGDGVGQRVDKARVDDGVERGEEGASHSGRQLSQALAVEDKQLHDSGPA